MSNPVKNPVGRPLLFKTPDAMQKVIDEYFEWCDNRAVKAVNKDGEEYMINSPAPYTMSGLARRLGMNRRTLVDYTERSEFLPTIKEARSRVEEDVETRMNEKNTFTPGLIFNAKENFGWKDKSEVENTIIMPKPLLNNLDVIHNNDSVEEAETTQEEN